MLLAAAAFFVHGMMVTYSQAMASVGVLPQPAVELSGNLHFHDRLARHVHSHDHGHSGHAHYPDLALDEEAQPTSLIVVCLGAISGMMPEAIFHNALLVRAGTVTHSPSPRQHGLDPGVLVRPPSTPSIA